MIVKVSFQLLLSFCLTTSACGQQKSTPKTDANPTKNTALKKNPFQQVEMPDSVLSRINKAIKRQEKLSQDAFPLYVFNLENHNDYAFHDGIYSYKLSSPHAKRRFFIVYKGVTTIFEEYYIDNVLQEYLHFIENKKIPTNLSIRYLKAISQFLEKEYTAEHS